VICWSKQTRWILIGSVLAGFVTDARALDPSRLPSQYVRERWTTETRFPGGVVNGIAQTADGYLWIGTDKGLLRFDGFDFRLVSFTSIPTASNVPILQLLTDAHGKLWIRPQGADLVRQKDGKFESVRYGPNAITALSKDINGGPRHGSGAANQTGRDQRHTGGNDRSGLFRPGLILQKPFRCNAGVDNGDHLLSRSSRTSSSAVR